MSFNPPPPMGRQPLGDAAREIERARVSELNKQASLNQDDGPPRRGLLARLSGLVRRNQSPDTGAPAQGSSTDTWVREAEKRRSDGRD